VLAIGFTALVNLAIITLFIWPDLVEGRAKWVGGAAIGLLWLAALWETRGELRRQAERRRAEREDRIDPTQELEAERQAEADRQLCTAQRMYLAGDWIGTERVLMELIKTNKEDIEAQLLLATVWRHLGRHRPAARRLHRIARLDAATPWRFEIQRELELIDENATAEIDPSDDHTSRPEAA
jgi:heme exporter protein D